MLFAERHRKLGRDGSRAHDRAEDLLTSTAFQLLRYLDPVVGLLAVLNRVRAVGPDGRTIPSLPPWLDLGGVTSALCEFWPRWGEFGEPDVVVTVLAGETPVGRLVVEAKLDATKSGEAGDEEATDAADPDQLRRYWQGLRAAPGAPPLGVVYLTPHATPPRDELAASLAREPGDWLGWLSWRDVWAAMRAAGDALPARDLAEILAAKGLKAFDGFGACVPPSLASSPVFWPRRVNAPIRWFQSSPVVVPDNRQFWRGDQE